MVYLEENIDFWVYSHWPYWKSKAYFPFAAKKKLDIRESDSVDIFLEEDGTEIDEDTFLSVSQNQPLLVCAKGSNTWLPQTSAPAEVHVSRVTYHLFYHCKYCNKF